MASEVEIVNLALTLLGESRIASLDDDVKPAREAKAVYETTRDALLAGYTWSFAKARAYMPALAEPPAFGYDRQFQLPVDCLRIIMLDERFFGLDLTDYRGTPTEEFTIEGRLILANLAAPLSIRYVKQVKDTGQFAPAFTAALGARLAYKLAESLTNSGSKKDRALQEFNDEIRRAVHANAIELPPQKLADDEWIVSRL